MKEFGFRVRKVEPEEEFVSEGWRVYLPHQCDAWDIAGGFPDGTLHDHAIEQLEDFIAEAQSALQALRERREVL